MSKVSIRFFDDREVRATWNEDQNNWWLSVLNIVAVLSDQDDYLEGALTDDIHSREMFMKGIDYSYYYEEN